MGLLLVVASGASGYVLLNSLFGHQRRYDGLTATVKKEIFKILIVEKGSLESVNNNDIHCRVKSNKGISIKIDQVIDDGTYVKKGDILVKLDASPLKDEWKTQKSLVDELKALWIKADKDYEITLSQNESDIKAAENALKLAEINLKKYMEGDYEVKKKQIVSRMLIAESDLKMWRDRVNWSQRMATKGYISKSQLLADKAKAYSAFLDLETAELELQVLNDFEKEKEKLDLEAKIQEAILAKKRAEIQAEGNQVKAQAELNKSKAQYDQELDRLKELEEEIENCIIRAPRDGLVVYYVPPQARWGRGSQQSIVASGEPVTFNQKMMQIPDLSRMMVKVRIHEAMISYLRKNGSPTTKQKAWVRVDAFSDRPPYNGFVKKVATIASQQDFLSSDVKVYETEVLIDQDVKDLRPGMSAEVTILAHKSPEPVLTIPLQSVVGTITSGKKRKCFVVDENGYATERSITLGLSNDTSVVVLEGLKEGEKVAMDPGSLLDPDSKMIPTKPRKKEGGMGEEGPGGKGKPQEPPKNKYGTPGDSKKGPAAPNKKSAGDLPTAQNNPNKSFSSPQVGSALPESPTPSKDKELRAEDPEGVGASN